MSISDERLGQLAHRFSELEARLASGTLEGEEFVATSRDYAELEPVAKAAASVIAARREVADLEAMLAVRNAAATWSGEANPSRVDTFAALRQWKDGFRA